VQPTINSRSLLQKRFFQKATAATGAAAGTIAEKAAVEMVTCSLE